MPNLLLLPATVAQGLEAAPHEEVVLARDELANMAWAIERVVESRSGRALRRAEDLHAELSGTAQEPPAAEVLPAYQIMRRVPPTWFPLLRVDGESGRRLERASMPDADPPEGRILSENWAPGLFDEEVPRAGALVTRAWQYARASGGSPSLWIGRQKRMGTGESSSGLRWDVVEQPADRGGERR